MRIVKGEFEIGTQHHFHLENHTTLVRPIEDGQYEVHSATQWMNMTQKLLSKTLGIPLHMFDMKVRRLGGAYGGKIDNSNLGALACAVAAQKLRRPVRLVMDIKSQMEALGKRLPYLTKYRVSKEFVL